MLTQLLNNMLLITNVAVLTLLNNLNLLLFTAKALVRGLFWSPWKVKCRYEELLRSPSYAESVLGCV